MYKSNKTKTPNHANCWITYKSMRSFNKPISHSVLSLSSIFFAFMPRISVGRSNKKQHNNGVKITPKI